MSEWYTKDINKKVKTGEILKAQTESQLPPKLYGYVKSPTTDFWIVDGRSLKLSALFSIPVP